MRALLLIPQAYEEAASGCVETSIGSIGQHAFGGFLR
jgi:hypothetical protein